MLLDTDARLGSDGKFSAANAGDMATHCVRGHRSPGGAASPAAPQCGTPSRDLGSARTGAHSRFRSACAGAQPQCSAHHRERRARRPFPQATTRHWRAVGGKNRSSRRGPRPCGTAPPNERTASWPEIKSSAIAGSASYSIDWRGRAAVGKPARARWHEFSHDDYAGDCRPRRSCREPMRGNALNGPNICSGYREERCRSICEHLRAVHRRCAGK